MSNVGNVSLVLSLWGLISLQGCVQSPPAFYLPTQSKKEIQSSLCKTLLSPRNSTEGERCPCSVIFHMSPLSLWDSGSLPKIHVLMWFSFLLLNVIWDSINIHQLMLSQLKLINSRVYIQHKIYFNSFVNYAMKSLKRLLTVLVMVDCAME